jgi:phosphatidylglycerophosphate synthase
MKIIKSRIESIKKNGQMSRNEIEHNFEFKMYQPWTPYLTLLLLKVKVTPNFITILSIIFAISGGVMLSFGKEIFSVIGGVFIIMFFALDFCDGEVARINSKQSMTGTYLDYMGDYFLTSSIVLGLIISLYSSNPFITVLLLGMVGLSAIFISNISSLMITQVVFTEYIRNTKRINCGQHKDIENISSDQISINNKGRQIINFFKRYFGWMYVVANGNLLGHFIFPLSILDLLFGKFDVANWNIGFLDIYIIYVCFISPVALIISLYVKISNKRVELSYKKFTNKKAKYSSNGGYIS